MRLVEGTGYKYDAAFRFYGWEHAKKIEPISACAYADLGDFYLACLRAWNIETCSARFRGDWSEADPSVGQCTITAHIVQELFGGEVLGLPLEDGGMHSFNRIDGYIVDVASEQFGRDAVLDYENAVPVDPDKMLEGGDKAERRALLKARLDKV